MISVAQLVDRVKNATFVQATRAVQLWARNSGNDAEVGLDELPTSEPIRFAASARMGLVANDVAEVEASGRQVRIVANVMGLAGATPALPPPYSELQLQRRRARDFAFGQFLSIFDHRALSFFYRIAQKYSWPLLAERAGHAERDPVQSMLVSLAGVGNIGTAMRLDVADRSLVTLVAHLSDTRRSAASVESVLQVLTGLPLRIIQAVPTWMTVPAEEQSRIGGPQAQFAQLGQELGESDLGVSAAAMIGAAVLDVQHHYVVEIGPLGYRELQDFCCKPESRRLISQLCALAAGIEHRPLMRLLIATDDIPPLRLGDENAPAMLGWTTWIGRPERMDGIADDCLIPIDQMAVQQIAVEASKIIQ